MTKPAQMTVRERIAEELDGRIHGMAVTARRGPTSYVVVTHSAAGDRGDRLVLTTVVVDLEADTVTPHGNNSLWVPRDAKATEGLTQSLARATTDVNNDTGTPPVETGVGVEDLLETEVAAPVDDDSRDGQRVDMMKKHTGIDPARSWGYGAGPPPEVDDVVGRLEEAGLDPSDHLTRLVFGKKEPMDRVPRPLEELKGNYGIELLPRDSGLIAIDVDYPEKFPEEFDLPETLEVSSPHGDDSQRHILLRCGDKEKIADGVTPEGKKGAWAVQAAPWGDLWIGDRYVVGPGSQLSEYGCDDGDHDRGEPGGCEACEDPERGFYRAVNDAPIATVDADVILGLLEASPGYELRNGPADHEPPEPEGGPDADDALMCDSCGTTHPTAEALKEFGTRKICRGGCV